MESKTLCDLMVDVDLVEPDHVLDKVEDDVESEEEENEF